MRILMFTGKGGVGKTTVAAATAWKCAALGKKTVIMSTDTAHSLSDSFDTPIGEDLTKIGKNLWGIEIDVHEELKRNWGIIQSFIMAVLKRRGFDDVVGDELSVLPGMEELFSLLKMKEFHSAGKYDVLIIDCAPTGGTVRLLSFPDMVRWYMERVFNIKRQVLRVVRPVVKKISKLSLPIPSNPVEEISHLLPPDEVFSAVRDLYERIHGMKDILSDETQCSIRLVMNAERMVVKEAQRSYTYLNLFGFSTDAVVVNRMLSPKVTDHFFDEWKKTQDKLMKEIKELFDPLTILSAKLIDREVVGKELLMMLAEDIYGDDDPTRHYHVGKVIDVVETDGKFYLTVRLPFTEKSDLDVWVKDDELIIKLPNYRRNVLLPRVLSSLQVEEAKLADGKLTVKFGGGENERTKKRNS
ncbi:MAG: TRC40/GET3/ArsA family transport-energizing ATPase [Candidatus Eisenbacteria bacterium]|nr:TRC40/GET3/ArsA family transport-energizing ATPase [Candidatus Eisenbacteria bacterium]